MFWLWRMWRRIGAWRGTVAQALLAWRLLRDPRVPWRAKAIIPGLAVYYLSPINLSFEWIPLVGQIDDVAIALLALAAFFRLAPQEVVAEHAAALERELARHPWASRVGLHRGVPRHS